MEKNWSFPTNTELGVLKVFKQDFLISLKAARNIEGVSNQYEEVGAFLPLLLQRTFEHSKYALAHLLNDPKNKEKKPQEIRGIISNSLSLLDNKVNSFNLNWQNNTKKILQRWQADKDEIAKVFFSSSTIGYIKSFGQHKGDEHQGGEQSLILELSCGRKLCYKPRCLKIEQVFYTFALALDFDELYQVTYLTKKDYGWMEFISHENCETEAQLAQYYFRSGLLLSLLYTLEAEDIHHENVIALGAHPVVVDLEMLFHHRDDSIKLIEGKKRTLKLGEHTVLKTHLIPQYLAENHEISAISPAYSNEILGRSSMPLYQGKPVAVNNYIEQFIKGYSQGYQRILANKELLLSKKSPVTMFASCTARYASRSTHIYDRLIKASQHVSNQSAFENQNILLDRLSVDAKDRPFLKRLITAEKSALIAGEIPRFTHNISTKNVYFNDKLIAPSYFSHSGIELSHQKLKGMSENDLQGQIKLIRMSFNLTKPQKSMLTFKSYENKNSKNLLTNYAKDIAAFVYQQQISHLNGAIWPVYKSDGTGKTCLDPTNHSFYDGALGIQFFLAHLHHIFPDVINSTSLISQTKDILQQQLNKKENCVGFAGLGGTLYAVSHFIHLWPEQTWLAQYAENVMTAISEWAGNEHDVISGSAGAILALLSFYQQSKKQRALTLATKLGHELVEYQHALSGFAHGTAGIGFALIKLTNITKIEVFQSSALLVLETESNEFSHELNNWPDMRFDTKSQQHKEAMTAWCHGALGISLSRLKMQKILGQDTPTFIKQDIQHGLNLLKNSNIEDDCLCHGNFGNYELYLSACEHNHVANLSSSDLHSLIYQRMELITNKGINHSKHNNLSNLGFMTGWSGLGYQILRFAYPEKVPNVLLLDFFSE
jgi:lantibiotic modifying enzyme